MNTKMHNGFEFPAYDKQCHPVVFQEQDKIDKIVQFCNQKRAVIQAGGNVGVFPAHLASIFSEVFTFEPDAENYECLKRNITRLGLGNVKASLSALGRDNASGRMAKPHPNNCGANTVVTGSDFMISRLDDVFPHRDDIDLLYLDIEGYECKALDGAKALIERCKPVIVVENKGLIPEFPSGIEGSPEFRNWICDFGYQHRARLMRDDVFIPV